AVLDILDVDPDVSFQEFDFAVGKAWAERQQTRDLGRLSPEEKRRVLELGESRMMLVLSGTHSSPADKQEAEKHLAGCRLELATLKTAPDLVFALPTGEPEELLRRASADDPHLTLWTRGTTAFGAGFELEKVGDGPAALAAYRKAYDWMRRASPTYAGLSTGIDMNLPPDKQHESKEPRLLREVMRAVQRLDPSAPDTLRGGIRFRVVGPQIPKNEVIKLAASLWDPSIPAMEAGFGSRTGPGEETFPNPPGSFPIQLDGTAWIGVAEGKYRLAVWRAEWGATGFREAGSMQVMLDLEALPQEVEIVGGQTIELPIHSHLLKRITLLSPAVGATLDLRTAVFQWSGVPEAKYYYVNFAHGRPIPGGMRTDTLYDAKVAATTFSLADIPEADVAKFSSLKRGTTGVWRVSAHDAVGHIIGLTIRDGSFIVARELGEE